MFFNKKSDSPPGLQRPGEKKGLETKWVWIIATVAVLLAVVVVAYMMRPTGSSVLDEIENFEIGESASSEYHAVFLTNGQVYFGRLASSLDQPFVQLEEVYYLQVKQSGEMAEGQMQEGTSLIRLGSEMHGPENSMEINRDHILFVEKLKSDSKIVEAIRSHQGN